MNEKTQEKSLMKVNKNIFYRIKNFFRNLFHKDYVVEETTVNKENIDIKKEDSQKSFMESIKNIENEETRLLKLQKQYRSGEIKEDELTQEQVSLLCDLYDKQIKNLRKSNEIRKQRLLEYRKKLTDN